MQDNRLIPLTKNRFALVDDEDFEFLNQWKWHITSTGYAARRLPRKEGYKIILMHRSIVNCPSKKETDHINGNKLDNRKRNLRICSSSQNKFNREKLRNNTTGYKNISLDKRTYSWRVQIMINYKNICSKSFKKLEDAIQARNSILKQYHGMFANIDTI